MLSLDEIRSRFEDAQVDHAESGERVRAAVALVLCDEGSGPEVLFIQRAEHDQDPWSGHLGFPGGRVEATDPDPRAAAERETREEVDLVLAGAEYLGRLGDLLGVHLPVVISCFVFGVRSRPVLTLNPAEVADAFWFPLENLLDPRLHGKKTVRFEGEAVTYPTIQLLAAPRPRLWGITYRLVSRFLEAVGRPL